MLEPAPLGVVTSAADLTSGLRADSRHTRQVTERYTMTTGKRLRRTARMTETRFTFTGRDGARLGLVVRAADDGVAYRYVLPGPGTVTVEREASAFRPPAAARAWLTPYSANYERLYAPSTASGAAPGEYAYPALFQVGDAYALLTESDVDGRYDASRLVHEGDGRYTVRLADPEVTSEGPLATPWRTAVVGDLATVTESTLVDDLAPPSRIADTSWIRPGKVAWSWLDGFGAAQRDLAAQQRFVDLAAARGWPYTLVDDGWKTTGWMPELIAYARQRGVDVLLWVHWTDLDTAAERAEFLPRVKEWGAAGLKIDFMDSDSQERFRWYDDILRDTARHRLLVNFHGATLPKGVQRTWPHVMSLEAVYGAEQGTVPAAGLTALPYTRNAVGSMDYTPMGFQFGTRTVSDAAELALSVVFESGFQNFAYWSPPTANGRNWPASWSRCRRCGTRRGCCRDCPARARCSPGATVTAGSSAASTPVRRRRSGCRWTSWAAGGGWRRSSGTATTAGCCAKGTSSPARTPSKCRRPNTADSRGRSAGSLQAATPATGR